MIIQKDFETYKSLMRNYKLDGYDLSKHKQVLQEFKYMADIEPIINNILAYKGTKLSEFGRLVSGGFGRAVAKLDYPNGVTKNIVIILAYSNGSDYLGWHVMSYLTNSKHKDLKSEFHNLAETDKVCDFIKREL